MDKMKIISCLDERLSHSEKKVHLKQANWQTVCGANVLLSVDDTDFNQADRAIVDWAKSNEVNLVIVEYGDPAYTQHDRATRDNITKDLLSVTEERFEVLNAPKTVLYFRRIDEMKDKNVRRYLLDFMRTNMLTFGDGEVYFAKNVLFAIATVSKDIENYEYYELCTVDAKDAFVYKID